MYQSLSGRWYPGGPGDRHRLPICHSLQHVAGTALFLQILRCYPRLCPEYRTKGNAEIAGLGDTSGTIEAGKCADIIVTRRNSLEGLDALRKLEMVVTRGQCINAPKVKKMEPVERELDRFLL